LIVSLFRFFMSFRHPLRAVRFAALGLVAPLALLAAPHATYAVGTADGNIPIGTTTIPTSEFGVYGGATIGTSYISTAAPTNGLVVQGSVGIGTTSPFSLFSLDMGGNNIGHVGTLYFGATSGTPQIFSDSGADLTLSGVGGRAGRFTTVAVTIPAASGFLWSSTADTRLSPDTGISRLSADKIAIGNGTVSNTSGTLIAGTVGIGTTSPLSSLSVAGNLALGSYGGGASTTAAPSNGLIVSGQTGIGTAAPNAAALLDVFSTTQGLLPPRVTAAQEIAIGTNVSSGGLLVYNTTLNELDVYDSATSQWEAVGANAADAAGSTGQVQFNSGGDLAASANFFWDNTHSRLGIGTSTMASTFEVNGNESIGYVDTAAPSNGLLVKGNVGIGTTSPGSLLTVDGGTVSFGPNQITNGSFTGSAAGWTLGNCVSYGANAVTATYSSCSDMSISQSVNTVAGQSYLIQFDVSGESGDVPYVYFNNNSFSSNQLSGGHASVAFTADYTGTDTLYIDAWDYAGTYTLDNVSMTEIEAAPLLSIGNSLAPNAVTIDPDGNVGIGAANAEYKLNVFGGGVHIQNGDGSSNLLTLDNSGHADQSLQIGMDGPGGYISANYGMRFEVLQPNHSFDFVQNGVEALRINGTNNDVGIGTTVAQTTLQVVGSIMMGTGTCGITTAGSIQYSGGAVQYCNGSVWSNIAGGPTGSGTTNYVARWTSPTALGTGVLYDNGSVVGIGTATPVATLDVNGYARLAKNASQPIACDAAHDGSLALAHTRRPCECVNSAWIDIVYGTACSW
jgi:hypothetical protein